MLFWLFASIVLGIIEALTVNLVTIWFAIGALAAFAAAAFCDSVLIQTAVFVAVSVLALALTRPLAKKFLKNEKTATNADRIIGKEAVVTEEFDAIKGRGKVLVMGREWSAKADIQEVIKLGETVIVDKIEGVRAVVSKKD